LDCPKLIPVEYFPMQYFAQSYLMGLPSTDYTPADFGFGIVLLEYNNSPIDVESVIFDENT
jgi:hypothetical protein